MQAAGPGWAPMDRSGVQRAAMGIDVSTNSLENCQYIKSHALQHGA